MTVVRSDHNFNLEGLATRLSSPLILPQDVAYDQARQLWNKKVNKLPTAFVRCMNIQDVREAVQWARIHGIPLSIRGGGHDYAGRALCNDGLVIDCSRMRAVSIDSERHIARVEGGATVVDLIDAAQKYGLATATGICSSVGLGGLTLGGGYGPLTGKCGLTTDNLISAQVVTADGEVLTASASKHPDLFWGLRGGGGNFGVVVSMEYRLYPIAKVLSGLLLYSIDQAEAILSRFDNFITTCPDELTIPSGFLQTPNGPMLFLAPVYCGPFDQGGKLLDQLLSFGKPIHNQLQPNGYDELIRSVDALLPHGRHYYTQTQSLSGFRHETIEILANLAGQFTSPFSLVNLHHFHGAASRVELSETAFGLRQDHLMVEIVAAWEHQSAEDDRAHVQWAQRGSKSLAPFAFREGYINLFDVEEGERVPLAFGANYERMLTVKRAYDPNDLFQSTVGHVRFEQKERWEGE